MTISSQAKVSRRGLLTLAAATALAGRVPTPARAQVQPVGEGTVRDHLWVFACPTNSDFPALQRRSVMSPAESAFYLGVPNLIMVQASTGEAKYGRFEPPFAQYATAVRPLKRVVWSLVGSGGYTSEVERREGLQLVRQTPNFVGVMLDDFFTGKGEGKRAILTVEELADIRRQLTTAGKKLDIFVTWYARDLDLPLGDYLKLIDVVTLWVWKPEDFENLEAYLKKVNQQAPHAKVMLGCYVVDYDKKKSTPVPAMEYQCELGLRWLREGRIEGIIFLGNTTMDLDFEAVEWTRKWIQKVGDAKI
jgi:hypothetical protein